MSTNGVTLKSWLEVVEDGAFRKLGYGFLCALHSKYGQIFSRFGAIHEPDR